MFNVMLTLSGNEINVPPASSIVRTLHTRISYYLLSRSEHVDDDRVVTKFVYSLNSSPLSATVVSALLLSTSGVRLLSSLFLPMRTNARPMRTKLAAFRPIRTNAWPLEPRLSFDSSSSSSTKPSSEATSPRPMRTNCSGGSGDGPRRPIRPIRTKPERLFAMSAASPWELKSVSEYNWTVILLKDTVYKLFMSIAAVYSSCACIRGS